MYEFLRMPAQFLLCPVLVFFFEKFTESLKTKNWLENAALL